MMTSFTSTVRDLSHKGLGVIDHPDGRVFFCRGVWPGDEAIFEVEKDAEKYAEAKLVELIRSSEKRVPVPCKHRGVNPGECGGCPWMIAAYDDQLLYKTKRLQHALEKRGIEAAAVMNTIIASPQWKYRNRLQLKSDGKGVGFVSEGTKHIAYIDECLVINEELARLVSQVKNSLPNEKFSPGPNHQWCYIDLDDEVKFEEIKVNKRRPFKQGNTQQNEVMKSWVKEQFGRLELHHPVIDLFCGSGNFTQVLLEMGFTNVLGVEVQSVALEKLKDQYQEGLRILDLDMNSKGSWAQVARMQPHAKAILVDPPREGMEKRRGLFKYLDNLEYIFYISCELDTFSRDARDIIDHGFQLVSITPIDLFPHTPHVEIMSVFQKVRHTF
jgi:23S rRNA (uracil1939-C5)-methyltransferase